MRRTTVTLALGLTLLALAPRGALAQSDLPPPLKDPPQTQVLPPPAPETPADQAQDSGGTGAAMDPLNEVFQDFTGGCGGPDAGGAGCGPEPDMPPPPP